MGSPMTPTPMNPIRCGLLSTIFLSMPGLPRRLPTPPVYTDAMFASFRQASAAPAGVEIPCVIGGSGPPLLLLHGFPQTRAIWHKVAPALAKRFTVVASDLRGYGDAGKPATDPLHASYSKRAMAADQVGLMRSLGFERFGLVGHDRGGRVAHRLAVDHPDAVERVAVLDICPTLAMYEQTDLAFARAYWHWFFLIQPAPLPETMINADPEFFLTRFMGGRSAGLRPFEPPAWAEYLRCARDPETVRAMCEDYRAAVSDRPRARPRRPRGRTQDRLSAACALGPRRRDRTQFRRDRGVGARRVERARPRPRLRSLRAGGGAAGARRGDRTFLRARGATMNRGCRPTAPCAARTDRAVTISTSWS